MGISGGPYIVRDSSLVLELDAADRNSYVSGSTVWNDISGNNLTASFTSWANVDYSGSYFVAKNFSGYMNNVQGISSSAFPQNSGSLSIWINMPQYNQASALPIFDNFSNTRNHFFIRHGSSQQLQIGAQDNVNVATYQAILTENSLQINQWYNITFTYVTGTPSPFNYYLNGILRGTTTISQSSWRPSEQFVGYGVSVGSPSIATGSYGPISIYSRNLSATEILQNYNEIKSRFGL